ncbi:helix-turn-helix domain-containing protein [Paenibacillus sp. 2TAB26]|uniref:helix-turn-helix domain-containing protein n=1 Tax=Paenibacillus sp. 2TAB26 TaxID=3233005 RepID=UPI003F97869B
MEFNPSFLAKLLHESLQLPVYWLSADDPSGQEYFESNAPIPFSALQNPEYFRQLIKRTWDKTFPVIQTTEFEEFFIVQPVYSNLKRVGTIIIGPSIDYVPSEETVRNLMNDNNIPRKLHPAWVEYLRSLPLVSKQRLFHIGIMAHWIVNQEELGLTDVLEYNFRLDQRFLSEEAIELSMSNMKEFSNLHTSQEFEQILLRHIKNGDKAALKNLFVMGVIGEAGTLSKRSHLRSRKNIAICAIAVAVRAGMEGGLYTELAYRLSDTYIQHIEDLTDVRSVETAMIDAFLDITDRVSENRKGTVSKPIAKCREYIFNHLYDAISISELAELTGLNGTYLSTLFKKETGLTISHFIHQEKIEEAKKLLDFTSESVSTIATRLNYYDQTHFIKSFKKHADFTPKQYRDRKRNGDKKPIKISPPSSLS